MHLMSQKFSNIKCKKSPMLIRRIVRGKDNTRIRFCGRREVRQEFVFPKPNTTVLLCSARVLSAIVLCNYYYY